MIDRQGRTGVGKRQQLVLEDRRPSATRSAALAGGTGLVAWGGPRIKVLGAALEHGAKTAKDPRVRDGLMRAESIRRAWLTGSQPLDRLGRMGPLASVGRKLPASLRPAAATLTGLGLARAGLPPTKTKRTPVVTARGF